MLQADKISTAHFINLFLGSGACKVDARVFYKWTTGGDPVGGSAPDAAPAQQSEPSAEARAQDLDIEKQKLQLVGIDAEKFDYFFHKYYDKIFEYAFWNTGSHDQADDITGEVFARAWERRGQFRWQTYSFGAWLFKIAHNIVANENRRQSVRKESQYDPDSHGVTDPTTPADVLAQKSDQELIQQCLGQLTESQYEIIVLHHFVGMTTRQISLVTKLPLGSVNSHLRRGKRSLQRMLSDQDVMAGLSDAAQRIVRQAAIDDSGLNVIEGVEKP